MTDPEGSASMPGAARERNPTPEESPEQLAARVERLLPLVRFNPGTRLFALHPWRFGLALFREGPVVFRTRRERFIPEAAWEAGGRAALLEARGIRVRFTATWEEITEVRAVQTNWRTVRFTFRAGARSKITEHEISECGHLFDALTVLLGARFQPEVPRERLSRRWLPSRLGPSLLVAAVVALGLLWLGGRAAQSTTSQLASNLGFAALLLGFLCAARVEAEWGRWLTRRLRSRRPAGVQPYRSHPLGLLLKLFGFALLVAQTIAPWDAIIAFFGPNPVFTFFHEPSMISVLLVLTIGLTALDLGHRLALRTSEGVLKDDARAPVVFLRSFEDDGVRNLNPDTQSARWLGLRGWFETGRGIVGRLSNVNPPRILRLAIGLDADTAEEQISRHLRKTVGPVVAIGQPGERVAQSGAARMYVGHDEWQQRVLEMLAKCRTVVLQPSETRGVWWEVDQCLERLERRQILLSLVSFIGSAQAFEAFRLKWEDRTGTQLPRRRGDAVFWRFGADWTPIPIALYESSPWLWPLTGNGIDWDRTLGSFTSGLESAMPTTPSHASRRTRLAAPAAATWALVGIVVAIAQPFVLDPWLEARAVASSSGVDWDPALSRYFNNWRPQGRWNQATPRNGFHWEVESKGGRYSAALARVPLDADVPGLEDYVRFHPGVEVTAADGRTWRAYGLLGQPLESWRAPSPIQLVCVDSRGAWILELTRPTVVGVLLPAATAAVFPALLDVRSFGGLSPDRPAGQAAAANADRRLKLTSLSRPLVPEKPPPPMWWAHYLERRPADPGRKLAIAADGEWSLALDAGSWDDVDSPDAARRWRGHGPALELAVWSQRPACDLEQALVRQFPGSTPESVKDSSSAGFTGSRSSSLQMAAEMRNGQGGAIMRALLVTRTRTAVHYLCIQCPSAIWEAQDPAVRRAVNGFLLLAEPCGSTP